uniref:Uncharacterized protein n=1 Tax=Fusarium oxysporum f. sp. albedinis TaxID=72712 RepID=A0A8A6W4C3_FUSOX|nr:hypothetical protein [Fusarium oxysporum f. sp. albedinis]
MKKNLKTKNNVEASNEVYFYFSSYIPSLYGAIVSFIQNIKQVNPTSLWIVFTLSVVYILIILLYVVPTFYDTILQHSDFSLSLCSSSVVEGGGKLCSTLSLEPIAMNKYGSKLVLNTTSFSIFFPPEKISSTDYDSSPLSLLVIIAKKFMGLFFKESLLTKSLRPHSLNMLKPKNELVRFPPGIPIALVELKNTYYINKAHALFNNTQDPSGRGLEGKAILFCISCFKYALGVLEHQARASPPQAKEK